jgi:hypothetical protein
MVSKPLSYTKMISDLSEGNHSLQVYVRSVSYYLDPNRPSPGSVVGWWKYPPAYYYMDTYSSKINFTVDTTPPTIVSISLDNSTFKSTDVPLVYYLNEPSEVSYTLDYNSSVKVFDNTTLTGLTVGSHKIVLSAKDLAGNIGKSNVAFFNIQQEEGKSVGGSTSNTALIVIIAITAISIIAVVSILFVFFARGKSKTA